MIKIKLLNSNSKTPERSTSNAAGYDIFAVQDYNIEAQSRELIKTGIALEIPDGYYGRIAPRSGIALKNGIDVMAGVIDSDYRGEIGVILYNSDKNNSFLVRTGDRIAQLIIEKYYPFGIQIVESLDDTDRGTSGFGSSGI